LEHNAPPRTTLFTYYYSNDKAQFVTANSILAILESSVHMLGAALGFTQALAPDPFVLAV
jgi:hypothetical protein